MFLDIFLEQCQISSQQMSCWNWVCTVQFLEFSVAILAVLAILYVIFMSYISSVAGIIVLCLGCAFVLFVYFYFFSSFSVKKCFNYTPIPSGHNSETQALIWLSELILFQACFLSRENGKCFSSVNCVCCGTFYVKPRMLFVNVLNIISERVQVWLYFESQWLALFHSFHSFFYSFCLLSDQLKFDSVVCGWLWLMN